MTTITTKLVTLLLVAVFVASPTVALAQSSIAQYQPRTTGELIAYLMGRIDQLREIQRQLAGGSVGVRSDNSSLFDYVTVQTQKADAVEATTAVLRGEARLFGDASAVVWFEYGQDEDFLDFRTRQVSVRSAYDRAVRAPVSRLEPDERYYFRMVAQDREGVIIYGEIFAFRTDEMIN